MFEEKFLEPHFTSVLAPYMLEMCIRDRYSSSFLIVYAVLSGACPTCSGMVLISRLFTTKSVQMCIRDRARSS